MFFFSFFSEIPKATAKTTTATTSKSVKTTTTGE
jgi:hypothetical protein